MLFKRIAQYIQTHQLCGKSDRILVAISGGPDSVFLAYVLQQLGYEIACAHVNFQLRGAESDAEEALVSKLAHQWQVPFFVKKVATKAVVERSKKSTQEVARQLRYDFFEEIMDQHGYASCALAHQADDQSEQAVLSLMLGNATNVLQSIPMKRERYIRPLLAVTREEIIDALQKAKLPFATDSSNLKNVYLRNRVRNIILPELQQLNSNASEQMRKKQRLYASQKGFLDRIFKKETEQYIQERGEGQHLYWQGFIEQWGKEHVALFVAFVLEQWGLHGHRLWQGVDLIDAQVGKRLEMDKLVLERTREGLFLTENVHRKKPAIDIQLADFETNRTISWEGRLLRFGFIERDQVSLSSRQHFYFSMEKLQFPLCIRPYQPGDFMQPFGMKGRKKISDIFVDEKYDTVQKRSAFVLEDQKGILLLSDFRIADRVKLTDQTQQIGVLFYE